MKRRIAATILLVFLSSFTNLRAANVRVWRAGVAEGDFFVYEMFAVFTSSDPNVVYEVPEFEQNNTEWVRIDISGVCGSEVFQVYTLKLKEGTKTFELRIDLDPSNVDNVNFYDVGIPVCVANLDVGDSLPIVHLTVNETFVRVYSNCERETNLVSWTNAEDWGYCIFDRKTGMLVDLYHSHSFVNSDTGAVITKADHVKMTHSSLWEIAEPPQN